MSSVGTRVRRALQRPGPVKEERGPATGGFDRVHDGLISGWLTCLACGTPPGPLPNLLLDGQPVHATATTTPRGDVPGGQGFLLRFPRTGRPAHTDRPARRVRVQCPAHLEQGMELVVDPKAWRVGAIGAIETSSWPTVTGWIAILDTDSPAPELIAGVERLPARGTRARPEVQAYLGAPGVGGFQVDLGTSLGASVGVPRRTALPDGTGLHLVTGNQVLATAEVRDSPLGPEELGCLTGMDDSSEGLSEQAETHLRHRFLHTEIDTEGDWRELLVRLGLEDHSSETEQWAGYLAHLGCTARQVAAWLAIRATQQLGAGAISPLPRSLDQVPNDDIGRLPEMVLTWSAGVIGANNSVGCPFLPVSAPAVAAAVDKVLVAGLVQHRSGLGQNARNSLRALDLAGIHGCAAPFFPAPGGWNPRLSAHRRASRIVDDHAVLLHLPIDRVIPSLSAQPALLRTDRLIGYFMWETQAIPRQFHRALELVDEIWTATTFVADSLRAVTDTPVQVTGHVVDTSCVEHVTRSDLDIRETDFVVHFSFDAHSTVARKNPNAVIDAFRMATDDDPNAVLLLKVRNFSHVESLASRGDPHAVGLITRIGQESRIRLVTDEWSHGKSLGLIALADCYVSLHRSEGFGFAVAESLELRTPVVVTAYSGVMDYVAGDGVWLVPYEKTPVLPGEYMYWEEGMYWAEADVPTAAQAIREVRSLSTRFDIPRSAMPRTGQNSLTGVSASYLRLLQGSRQ